MTRCGISVRRAPWLVLLLALFVPAALAPALACQDRPVAAASSEAVFPAGSSTPSCPGCSNPAHTPNPARGPAIADRDVDTRTHIHGPSPAAGVEAEPCTSDRPCHDAPSGEHRAVGDAVQNAGASRDSGPSLTPVCVDPPGPRPLAAVAVATGPVRPAVARAPVAVLCVDRN